MSKWVDWSGGECPVALDTTVDAVLRDGFLLEGLFAEDYRWSHGMGDSDIVKYSVVSSPAEITKDTNPKDAIGVRKAPMSTVPMNVVAEVGVAMLEGGCKYGRHNYRAMGVRASVYFDATMRHLLDWWEGVDIDPDSGMSHITKAITSLTVLRDAQLQGMCTDDRPPSSPEFYQGLNVLAGEIIDKYKDKNPRHYTIEDDLRRQ